MVQKGITFFGIFYLGFSIRGWKTLLVPQLLLFWRDPNSNSIFGVPGALCDLHNSLIWEKMLKLSPFFKGLAGRASTMVPRDHRQATV